MIVYHHDIFDSNTYGFAPDGTEYTPNPGFVPFDIRVGGFNISYPNGDTSAYLWDFVIDKKHRGIGYGKQMVQDAIQEARKLGASVLTLCVFPSNKKAQHVYKDAGFVITSDDSGLIYMAYEIEQEV